jgi:hypothetical protein
MANLSWASDKTMYTIVFHRSEDMAQRFERAGIPNKPAGMVQSSIHYRHRDTAVLTANHVNAGSPEQPCIVVELKILPYTKNR